MIKMDFFKNQLTFSKKRFYDLYDEQGYYKIKNIKYKQGENNFLVIAEDYNGNKKEETFKLNINLDM